VAKLNSTGSSLIYSTFLGNGQNTLANGIASNAAGDAYVTGWAFGQGFPVTSAAPFGTAISPSAFVTRIADSTAACSIAITPGNTTIPAYPNGGYTFSAVAPSGCAWTATSNQNWAVISGASGAGTEAFTATPAQNTSR